MIPIYICRVRNTFPIFADTIRTNARSQHVLEKIGFTLVREDENYKYYRIDNKETGRSCYC